MFIKKILEYQWNYAEYIVSDGVNDVICICMSVPLPDNVIPKEGMEIRIIEAFSCDDIKVNLTNDNSALIQKGKSPLEYLLRGEIINKNQALIKVGNLTISLSNDYPFGFPKGYEIGSFVEFHVDRLDSYIV